MLEKYTIKAADGCLYKITVEEDECAMMPFDLFDYSEVCCMVQSRPFSYSTVPGINTFEDVFAEFSTLEGVDTEISSIPELIEVAESQHVWMLPIWGYSHSGLVLSVSETNPFGQWDSGIAGLIWVREEDLIFDSSKEGALAEFRRAVDDLNKYISNSVYCMQIDDVMHNYSELRGSMYFKNDYPTKEEILEEAADCMGFSKEGSVIVDECDEAELFTKRQLASMHLAEVIRKYKQSSSDFNQLSANLQITLDQVLAEATHDEIL